MIIKILVFFISFSSLVFNSFSAFAQDQEKKVYNYEQTSSRSKVVKKDLKIKVAVFVSENNLKFKDSLPPVSLSSTSPQT